jgi:hypothetical protein
MIKIIDCKPKQDQLNPNCNYIEKLVWFGTYVTGYDNPKRGIYTKYFINTDLFDNNIRFLNEKYFNESYLLYLLNQFEYKEICRDLEIRMQIVIDMENSFLFPTPKHLRKYNKNFIILEKLKKLSKQITKMYEIKQEIDFYKRIFNQNK